MQEHLLDPGASGHHPLLGGAHRLIGAVDAAYPATRPALAFVYFVFHDDDVFRPCLGLGASNRPADPLIPRQRRDVFPHSQHLFIGQNCLGHIVGQLVNRPAS